MDANEYKYLEDTLTGRRQRDPKFESQLRDVINPKTAERQRQIDSMTHEERELEQREFSLKVYGRENMLRYARPIIFDRPLGALQVPGDVIVNASPPQIKGHSGGEEKTWCDENGRLKLQFHTGEPGCYLQKGLK